MIEPAWPTTEFVTRSSMRWDFVLFFASLIVTALGEWGLYIGVIGMAGSVVHGTLKSIASRKARKMTVILGLIASGTIFLSLLLFQVKPKWFGLDEQKPASVATELPLLVECNPSQLPSTVPPSGRIIMVSPFRFDTPPLQIGIGGRNGVPGTQWTWPSEWLEKWSSSTLRCDITNYGKVPIFAVKLPISVTFVKIEKDPQNPNASRATKAIGVAEGVVELAKLEPGIDKHESFYMHNQGRDVLRVEFPRSPTFVLPGETERRKAQLMPISGLYSSLWPVRDWKDILSQEEENKKG